MNDIPARKTEYRGYLFRSALEARWAAFFDQLGIEWIYEPLEMGGYIPDFILPAYRNLAIEVKPLLSLSDAYQYVDKISQFWDGDFLIVGANWQLGSGENEKGLFKANEYVGGNPWINSRIAGLYGRFVDDWEELNKISSDSISKHITDTYFWCLHSEKVVFFSNFAQIDLHFFIGQHASEGYIELHQELERAWATAHRATQWMPKK